MDEYAPYKKVTKNEFKLLRKPWLNKWDSVLKKTIDEKDPLLKFSMHNDYKQIRNEITDEKGDGNSEIWNSDHLLI